jgi:hypothetical protein
MRSDITSESTTGACTSSAGKAAGGPAGVLGGLGTVIGKHTFERPDRHVKAIEARTTTTTTAQAA